MNKNKFDFYDIVKVSSKKIELKEINGREGVIQGHAQSEEDPSVFSYAVTFFDKKGNMEEGWSIFEIDLIPTGKKANRSDFFTGESIRVRVDRETGEGEIINEDTDDNKK